MDRLTEQQAGNKATAKWANQVVDELRRQHLIPGNGVRLTVTSNGTRLDITVPDEASSESSEGVVSDVIPCIVDGGTALDGYAVTLYLKGFDHSSRSDIKNGTLFVPEIATHTDLPRGASVLAHICEATFMQSDEQEDEEDQNTEGGQS